MPGLRWVALAARKRTALASRYAARQIPRLVLGRWLLRAQTGPSNRLDMAARLTASYVRVYMRRFWGRAAPGRGRARHRKRPARGVRVRGVHARGSRRGRARCAGVQRGAPACHAHAHRVRPRGRAPAGSRVRSAVRARVCHRLNTSASHCLPAASTMSARLSVAPSRARAFAGCTCSVGILVLPNNSRFQYGWFVTRVCGLGSCTGTGQARRCLCWTACPTWSSTAWTLCHIPPPQAPHMCAHAAPPLHALRPGLGWSGTARDALHVYRLCAQAVSLATCSQLGQQPSHCAGRCACAF